MMAKAQYGWNRLATDYKQLWDRQWHENAEEQLTLLIALEAELSKVANTYALHDQKKMEYWQKRVHEQYDSVAQSIPRVETQL